jgi:hypothetical protein
MVLQYAPELSNPPANAKGSFVFHLATRHAPHLTDEREALLAQGARTNVGPNFYTYRTLLGDIHTVHQFAVLDSMGDLAGEHPRALWAEAFGAHAAAMWRTYGQVVTNETQRVLKFAPELSDLP